MKRKLTTAQKKAKAERKKKYEWIFINGKQVRVKRPELIEGMEVDDFIAANASDVWLAQHQMYDVLDERQQEGDEMEKELERSSDTDDPEIPF